MHIAVVGGSLTGPLTALLLNQAGFTDVKVYEAVQPSHSRSGGVIGLDHASLDVLDGLGIPRDEFIEYPTAKVISHNMETAHRAESTYAGLNTTWTRLHQTLVRRLPDGMYKEGYKLQGIHNGSGLDFGPHGYARREADLIIGADGRKSAVRRIVDPDRKLHYAGYVAHRGWSRLCPDDLEAFTRYEMMGLQFNIFPVEGGVDWTFYIKESAEDFLYHYGGRKPEDRSFVFPKQISQGARNRVDSHAYALLGDSLGHIVQGTLPQHRMAAPVLDIDPPQAVVFEANRARVVLLGDALAPVRPHTARGMNNGVEQAFSLVRTLKHHLNWKAELDPALRSWESRVLPGVLSDIANGPLLANRIGL